MKFTAILGWLMAASITLGAPLLAHENHNELGAGPGIEAKVSTPDLANMHENMVMSHEDAASAHEDAAEAGKTFAQRLVSWVGRMHPFSVHFPIAMFFGALMVELFGLWRRDPDLQRAAFVMLVVGALGSVVAAALGWFAGGFYLTDRNPILMVHRWLGTALALFALVLVFLTARGHRRPDQPRTIYWILLAVMTGSIAVQGYIGASFMHGGMRHGMF
jgi:uncharacterized membrane protein